MGRYCSHAAVPGCGVGSDAGTVTCIGMIWLRLLFNASPGARSSRGCCIGYTTSGRSGTLDLGY